MNWRDYFLKSDDAVSLEKKLEFQLVEFNGSDTTSTASSDVHNHVINLDITQPPEKCALSYAYELKNIDNAKQYQNLNEQAKQKQITKNAYIKRFILLEAEAAFFRCKVYKQLGITDESCSFMRNYLNIYDECNGNQQAAIQKLALYMQENGIVKKQFAVKKYYADCYDFFTNKIAWPTMYSNTNKKDTSVLENRTIIPIC